MTPQNQAEAAITKEVSRIVEKKTEKYLKQGGSIFTGEEILHALNSNEDGDAWLFANLFKGSFCYDHAAGRWYEFNGHYWVEDKINQVTAALEDVVNTYAIEAERQSWQRIKAEKKKQTEEADKHEAIEKLLFKRIRDLQASNRKTNVLHLSCAGRDTLGISGDEWNRAPMVLGCRNNVIDLKAKDTRPGNPEDYINEIAPTEWRGPKEPAPTWERFLDEIFDGDRELISYIQRLFGYAITGKSTEHIYPIFYGQGRNGKSTLFETIAYVLGDLAGPIEAEMLLAQRNVRQSGRPTSDIIALRGKRIVWASETGENRRLNSGKLKWLTGGDTLTGRAPYGKRQVTFKPSHTLFLLTNHKPHAPANDFALWSRIHLVPFNLSFVENPIKDNERKVDPGLAEKLKEEAPGILVWLIAGYFKWEKQGLDPPEAVKVATEAYRKDEDLVGQFISECCVVMSHARVKAGELREAYEKWCDESGEKPLSRNKFASQILNRFDRDDSGRFRIYIGIGLKNNGKEAE